MAAIQKDLVANEGGDEICPICLTHCPTKHLVAMDAYGFACPRCGPFNVTIEAEEVLRAASPIESWVLLSGWCRDQEINGRKPVVSIPTLNASKGWSRPKLPSRANRLLQWAVLALDVAPNDPDAIRDPAAAMYLGCSYSASSEELGQLRRILCDRGDFELHDTAMGGVVRFRTWLVTGQGRVRAEEITEAPATSSSAFVAMWFSDDLMSLWQKGIAPGIMAAGYDPVRVDQVEHIGRIDDRIMLEIKRSRFVVADFTGHRGGVYFEAGYATGLSLPVLWTCRADDLDGLHFDIRQYNCLVWRDPADLSARLQARIENVVGRGPHFA